MTKKRSTKSALISSVLALFLCVSMLVGTTFAWFTDSVSTEMNKIVAGNLDIELYYQAEGQTDWTKVGENTNIFKEDTLWEPGHTEVVKFKIVNEGTLALKYQLGVNVAKETPSTNVAGEPFKLSDYIKYGIVDGAQTYTRETAIAAVDATATKLNVAYESGTKTLQPKAENSTAHEAIVTMVVYMPETVGNEANAMMGAATPSINLGIHLRATQVEAEEDSFGPEYDAGSPWLGGADIDWYVNNPDASEFEINTPEQLAGIAAIVNGTATATVSTYASTSEATTIKDDFAGQTIKLTGDVDLNNMNWTPIGTKETPFKGTFDGQGHTVSNLYIDDIENPYQGLFGYVRYQSAMIKGVNVHNVNIMGYSNVGTIAGEVYTGSISDCHVTGSVKLVADYAYAGGIVGGDYVNISNCSVIADGMGEITVLQKTGAGGICGWHTEGVYQMVNCHVKNLNITAYANLGGITGFVHYENIIDGCSVENVTLTKIRVDGHPSIGMAAGGWSYNASKAITITNNTFKNITFNGNFVAVASADLLHGSEYGGSLNKNFVLDNNTQENITNNMVEVNKISDGIVEKNGVYQIYNANGLASLGGTKVNGVYELMADLDMTGYELKPIAISGSSELTFVGNGHTISNVTFVSDNQNGMPVSALFNVNYSGKALTVSDLTIKNATSTCDDYSSVVVAYNSWNDCVITLNNVDVVGATVTGATAAGLVGYSTGVINLTDCDVSGLNLTGERDDKIGALVGTANTTTCVVTAVNCTNKTNYRDFGRVINGAKWNGGYPVSTTAQLIDAIKNAPVGSTTTIYLADMTYDGNIDITVAALGKSGGDVVIKAMEGAKPVISGTVTLGYRNQGVGAAMYDANVTFEGVTFNHAESAKHSFDIQDVKSLTLTNCTIIGDGEYGITSARGNAAGTSKIVGCTFENAAMQLLGNLATGLVIDDCTFNNSRVNVQAGNGVTIKNCEFNGTVTDAHVGDSFYFIRSNSTPITVMDCEMNVDSTVTGVATNQAKWYLLANRGTTNWTVENVAVTLTDAATAQTTLVVTACTSTGVINTTNLTVNGVLQ